MFARSLLDLSGRDRRPAGSICLTVQFCAVHVLHGMPAWRGSRGGARGEFGMAGAAY